MIERPSARPAAGPDFVMAPAMPSRLVTVAPVAGAIRNAGTTVDPARATDGSLRQIPTIETGRLRLTTFAERHFEAYASMLADARSTRFVGDGQPLDRMNAWRSMAMLLGHWCLRGYGMWAVELKDSGEFVGRAGLHNPEGWPDLELGWMLMPEHRGNGYATEAARAALGFAFSELHAARASSLIRVENTASERVARRLGGRQATTIDFLGGATLVYVYHPSEPDA